MAVYRMVIKMTLAGEPIYELHKVKDRNNLPPVEGIPCKVCGSEHLVRFGTYKAIQRYRCKDCGSTFMDTASLPHGKVDVKAIGSALHAFYEGLSLNAIRRRINQDYGFYPSDSTIYRWVARFTPSAVGVMDCTKYIFGDCWVADEMAVKVEGKQMWLWDIMDAESRWIIATRLSTTRGTKDAEAVFRLAKRVSHRPPKVIVTDKLSSYIDGIERVFGSDSHHVQSQGMRAEVNNNLSERLQGTIRQRTKVMRGFQNRKTAQLVLDGFRAHYNEFRPHEGIGGRTPAEIINSGYPYRNWTDIARRG